MELTNKPSNKRLAVFSLILGIFIVYPNIIKLWDGYTEHLQNISFFLFRYLFFCTLIGVLLYVNIRIQSSHSYAKRFIYSFLMTIVAYIIYLAISFITDKHLDKFTGMLIFQFIVVCILCSMIGYIYELFLCQREKENEIERLKLDNMESRYEALANQINPHIFFNSLNGLTALVRSNKNEQSLEYIDKLSCVFRYILHSDKKGLVLLSEELDFLDSFRFLQEIRYEDKLSFNINVPQNKRDLLIPVLSLLPLAENVVKHNMIDSENRMIVSIFINHRLELVVSNPIHEKLDRPSASGIGLSNLESRFSILLDKEIRVENRDGVFDVFLPLKTR